MFNFYVAIEISVVFIKCRYFNEFINNDLRLSILITAFHFLSVVLTWQGPRKIDLCSALIISFEIVCCYALRTQIYKY